MRFIALLLGILSLGLAQAQEVVEDFPAELDPQSWVLPEWMTWDDYVAIPGVDWNDPALQPVKKLRSALILGDFPDREFVVTLPEGGDYVGLNGVHNPIGVGSIPRDEVARFYAEFLITTPSVLNNFHTVNEYWLEDSYGLIGVDARGFGPYEMDFKEHEYGLGGGDAGGGAGDCPAGDECGQDFDNELIQKSLVDVTVGIAENGGEDYDFRFLLHAGYDESGTWQEFGEMLFPTRHDVPDILGNPDPDKPNFSSTRYVEWSSFFASEGIWSHALPGVTSTQGESDAQSTYAHELSHIFGVLDNYNNPFSDPPRRSYTGLWAMLSRGTFNGPGGTHERWRIPGTLGGSMGSHHMLRNKMRLGFMKPNEVNIVSREALAATGPQIATIYPRAYPLFPTTDDIGLHGMVVLMGDDRSPACDTATQFDCDGGGYTSYTVEVVDRIGFDSFAPDHGVLIAKNKEVVDLAPFMWVIDAHPEDINQQPPPAPNQDKPIYDFIRPTVAPNGLYTPSDGERVPIVAGDARQLVDALFHAGTGEHVVSEYLDEANGLHFYVLDTQVDARGVRSYEVGVRAAGDAGLLAASNFSVQNLAPFEAVVGQTVKLEFSVHNASERMDFFRLSVAAPAAWQARVLHQVIAVPAGETRSVPVFVKANQALAEQSLQLMLRSETDSTATASALVQMSVRDTLEISPARSTDLGRGGALNELLLVMLFMQWRRLRSHRDKVV